MKPIKAHSRKLNSLALALALSAGTIGGMMAVASFSVPAMAKGGGGGGPGGSNGGEPGGVMAITHATPINALDKNPNGRQTPRDGDHCGGHHNGVDMRDCKFTQRKTARIIHLNGHPNCAIVQQIPSPNGGAPEFYCLRRL